MECRICFETHNQETLISPCKCSGTSKYVHKECLDKWIVYKKNDICSVCQEKYSYYPQENDKTMSNVIIKYILKHDFCTTLITGFIICFIFLSSLFLRITIQNLISSFYISIFGMIFIQWYFCEEYIDFESFYNIILSNQTQSYSMNTSQTHSLSVIIYYCWTIVNNYKYILLTPYLKS